MFNKAILMGRLTRDPEQSTSPSGVVVTRFTLAVDRRFQRQGEEKQTDFLNIVAFNKTAEFVKKYFVKGQLALVSGSIQTRSWDGQDGQKRYATDIIAEEVNFVGSKKDNPQGNSAGSDFSEQVKPSDNEFMPLDDDDSLPF
ncbi:MAG: single-stranded DNA-binding protein [Ruminococcaceae bacterium]|nr:single-stranded DNA-binding protein [Oscillospiraceae bacterium]